jgi:hypothetical protein
MILRNPQFPLLLFFDLLGSVASLWRIRSALVSRVVAVEFCIIKTTVALFLQNRQYGPSTSFSYYENVDHQRARHDF